MDVLTAWTGLFFFTGQITVFKTRHVRYVSFCQAFSKQVNVLRGKGVIIQEDTLVTMWEVYELRYAKSEICRL